MKTIMRAADLGLRQGWLWRNRSTFAAAKNPAQPELLVDVSAIIRHDARTGIQRVVRSVWSELERRTGRDFVARPVYATRRQGYCYAPIEFLEQRLNPLSCEPVCMGPGDKFLGLDFSAHLLPMYRRQLKSWRANGATVHLLVYDLLPLLRPDWFTTAACDHYSNWLDVLVKDSDQAICISDQVANELKRQLRERGMGAGPSVGRLRMGGDIAASVPSRGLCARLGRLIEQVRFRPAILMVGTIEPRKGYDVALAAFEHLWSERPHDAPDLVIVGKPGWKTVQLQSYIRTHPEQGKRLHWFDDVSDEGLCLLYEACRALLMSSHGEGFGLPLIEASMHGKLVLARDLPVFREHGLSNVSFFSEDDPRSLSKQVLELMEAASGPAEVGNLPTWSECVEDLIASLGILGGRRSLEIRMRKAS